jgi:hypothetical protein
MTGIRYTNAAVSVDKDGTWLKLCVLPADAQKARRAVLDRKDKVYMAELKEHREKRSLDANAYFWRLLDELAVALGDEKESLYMRYVKERGIFRDFCLLPEEVGTFRKSWSMLGSGWQTEQVDYAEDGERLIIRAYYGSSTYNTKQMSRLIDSVVEDCKAVGIETLPPDKLAIMKEEWHGCTS